MKKAQGFPSTWINAADVHGKGVILMKVAGVACEDVGSGDNVENKPVMTFSKSTVAGLAAKRLVLGKVRWDACENVLGADDSDRWIGGVIGLQEGSTTYGGKRVACVEIVPPPAPAQIPAPKPEPVAAPADQDF